MAPVFVNVLSDVYCEWHLRPPTYRVWVNDELFTERTWIWHNEYLEENIAICAPPGEYQIEYELIPSNAGKLSVRNMRVAYGPEGTAIKQPNILRIPNENS
jgi:hypothetical protein